MGVVENVIYVDGRRALTPGSLATTWEELQEAPQGGNAFCWIGLLRPTEEEVDAVAEEFGLHPLAVKDTISAHQRPKLEQFDDVEFVVLRPARYVDRIEVIELGEIHLFVGPNYVITVRHADEPDLADVRKQIEERPELLAIGPRAVLYAIIDRVVDDYVPALDELQNDLDEIEVQVFQGDPGASRRIYTLTREVIEFQRGVEPLGDVIARLRQLVTGGDDGSRELRRALRDVSDRVERIRERTDGARQLLASILQVDATIVAQQQNAELARLAESAFAQNEQVKRISSWAAIFFAPTLVAGIYGMHFEHMPELGWTLGYPFAFVLMLALAAVLFVAFRRRGWV